MVVSRFPAAGDALLSPGTPQGNRGYEAQTAVNFFRHRKRDLIHAGMGIHKKSNIYCRSALPAGLGRKDGDALLHLCTFTLRTRSFDLAMLGNALNERKFLFTALAFIFVCGHVLLLSLV